MVYTAEDLYFEPFLFFRKDAFQEGTVFYPVKFLKPSVCGKSFSEQASEHAERNPGTLRVETVAGDVIWKDPTP